MEELALAREVILSGDDLDVAQVAAQKETIAEWRI